MVRRGQTQPVEDTARGLLAQLMNQIIEEEDLPFEWVDQQWPIRFNGTQKYADLVVWIEKHNRAACIIEYKPPLWSVLDMTLIGDAESKAFKISPQAPYFATWNTNELALFATFDTAAKNVVERRRGQYRVASVGTLKELWKPEVQNFVRNSLKGFLSDLANVIEGTEELPSLKPDDFFVHAIRSAVEAIYFPIADEVKRRHKKDKNFAAKLNQWFVEQGWSVPSSDVDYEKVARQFAYLLGDKVLFYHALRRAGFSLPDLRLPKSIKDGEKLKTTLQSFFEKATEVTRDYEPVFAVNFVDHIPLPESIVPSISSFVNSFGSYDLSKLEYGDIGKIFDSLIPERERHLLGQYFTPDHVVDLINAFCIQRAQDKVADFGCGVGTFLVRAYGRKRFLGDRRSHSKLIEDLYGVDISKFPAHLATINLVIRDLASKENYPRIFNKDFFDLSPKTKVKWGWEPVGEKVTALDFTMREVELPVMDTVVGNPPYTRQEEIEEILGEGYKKKLDQKVAEDWQERVKMGRRAGIHAYFFLHGMSFLGEGGRFGYVVSNTWLDVDYGKHFQEFFLKHSKILAIIEPKLERWFAEADVNTCIVVLERCSGPIGERKRDKERRKKKRIEREENVVRFAQLKEPLSELLGPDDDGRFKRASQLVESILRAKRPHEDEDMRVLPKRQKELWDEGYDTDKDAYLGSKWGKYVRAPDIYFKVLDKGKDVLVPLRDVASVRRGFSTGANKFFYLTEEDIGKWGIEKEFWMHKEKRRFVPNYLFKSPRECKSIEVNPEDLKYRVLLIHKDKKNLKGTKVLRYIKWGEDQGFHKRKTCRSRKRWYDLGKAKSGEGSWIYVINDRYVTFLKPPQIYEDCELFSLCPQTTPSSLVIALLNSSIALLFSEVESRLGLGLGALKKQVYELEGLLVPNPANLTKAQQSALLKAFSKMCGRPIGSVFDEFGAATVDNVSISSIKPDRRALDKILMEEIIGLTEEEQVDIYKGILDMVTARRARAESVGRVSRLARDKSFLVEGIFRELDDDLLKLFPEDFLPKNVRKEDIAIPSAGLWDIGVELDGRVYIEIDTERIYCKSKEEAQYFRLAAIHGARTVALPKNQNILKGSLREYRGIFNELRRKIGELVDLYVPDRKRKEELELLVWARIGNRKEE